MRKKKKHEDEELAAADAEAIAEADAEVASEDQVSETLDAAANPPPEIEGEGLKKPGLSGETKAEAKARRNFEHPGTNNQTRVDIGSENKK